MSTAISNLQTTVLNYQDAKSRIVDVDVAQESANAVKYQIIQRASASILAQANQGPALAMMLIQLPRRE